MVPHLLNLSLWDSCLNTRVATPYHQCLTSMTWPSVKGWWAFDHAYQLIIKRIIIFKESFLCHSFPPLPTLENSLWNWFTWWNRFAEKRGKSMKKYTDTSIYHIIFMYSSIKSHFGVCGNHFPQMIPTPKYNILTAK